jgi:26S proteasome regulatory subunit N8
MPLNHQIAYHLQDALNLLPDLRDPALTGAFATSTNDELLVVYLSALVRAVLALHALVDNKEEIRRVEMEEGKEKEFGKDGEEKDSKEKKEGDKKDENKDKSIEASKK